MKGQSLASGRKDLALLRSDFSWSIFAANAAPELRDGSVEFLAIMNRDIAFCDEGVKASFV